MNYPYKRTDPLERELQLCAHIERALQEMESLRDAVEDAEMGSAPVEPGQLEGLAVAAAALARKGKGPRVSETGSVRDRGNIAYSTGVGSAAGEVLLREDGSLCVGIRRRGWFQRGFWGAILSTAALMTWLLPRFAASGNDISVFSVSLFLGALVGLIPGLIIGAEMAGWANRRADRVETEPDQMHPGLRKNVAEALYKTVDRAVKNMEAERTQLQGQILQAENASSRYAGALQRLGALDPSEMAER